MDKNKNTSSNQLQRTYTRMKQVKSYIGYWEKLNFYVYLYNPFNVSKHGALAVCMRKEQVKVQRKRELLDVTVHESE